MERVVRRELLGHVVVIVLGYCLEPRGVRIQAGGLRRQLACIRVGPANDQREPSDACCAVARGIATLTTASVAAIATTLISLTLSLCMA